MSKVVWILGAGFSKFLGGPLLPEFFSPSLQQRVVQSSDSDFVQQYDALYRWYRGETILEEMARGTWTYPWRNAEEFSELLEAAACQKDSQVRIRAAKVLEPFPAGSAPFSYTDFQKWSDACKRYMATACYIFMDSESSIDGLERWMPYTRWVQRRVAHNDVILTFNYDLVVERAFSRRHSCEVVLPHDNYPRYSRDCPVLLKLHGSATWFKETSGPESGTCRDDSNPFDAMRRGEVPWIATPGPLKMTAVREDFGRLWSAARRAFTEADAVVFIGYRFPESDVEAKGSLLSALSANNNDSLFVRIVLGPNTDNDDGSRLRGLLHWALRGRTGQRTEIVSEPMYAQDFLGVFERDGLIEGTSA